MHRGFRWEDLRERDNLEDLKGGEKKMLKSILEKWDGEHGLGRSGSG